MYSNPLRTEKFWFQKIYIILRITESLTLSWANCLHFNFQLKIHYKNHCVMCNLINNIVIRSFLGMAINLNWIINTVTVVKKTFYEVHERHVLTERKRRTLKKNLSICFYCILYDLNWNRLLCQCVVNWD